MSREKSPETLQEAIIYFADPERSLHFMADLRWPTGVVCPTCGGKEVTFLATRKLWKCKQKHARQQFSIKVGTIFEDSPISLEKWLPAMWMLVNCKNGISSYEVARSLEVTQKTAWFMLHRIRLATQTGSFLKLGGTVEIDETWIGGKARSMNTGRAIKTQKGEKRKSGPHSRSGKAIVLGMLERGGKVVLKVVPNVRRSTLMPEITKHVTEGTEIHTDSLASYAGIEARSYETLGESMYRHKIVDHAVEYVKDNVHVNGMENFWSLLKRAIRGTYVSVEPFHLYRYLDEQAYRFNERKNDDGGRFVGALRSILNKRLTYKRLIGQDVLTLAAT